MGLPHLSRPSGGAPPATGADDATAARGVTDPPRRASDRTPSSPATTAPSRTATAPIVAPPGSCGASS